MAEEPLLHMAHIVKTFPGVCALDDVELTVYPGEILGLVGENGAGKSTLMRILNGVFAQDSGTITWHGQPVSIHSPHDAQRVGISMIHQELALIPYLDVGKNIYLGREPRGLLPGVVHWRELYRQAAEQLKRVGLDIPPRTQVRRLPLAQQQMVEVAKALSLDARLIVMDEPTSSLTDREVETLFQQMRALREQGVSIIFISHRLEEIFEICDRVTVLRDGHLVGTEAIGDLTPERIINMMVGRELGEVFEWDEEHTISDEYVLEVESLSAPGAIEDISFKLRRGEILGVAGLVGAGRTELAETIFGARSASHGTVTLNGAVELVTNPEETAEPTLRRFAPGDILALVIGIISLGAFMLLPWLTVETSKTGFNLLFEEAATYHLPLPLLLAGASGMMAIGMALAAMFAWRTRWPSWITAAGGLAGLLYHALYFIENGQREVKIIEPLGPAFWITLLAGLGLVAQGFIQRAYLQPGQGGAFARGFRRPAQAIQQGIGFVPEDRKGQGLFLHMTVVANIVMALMTQLSRWGLIRRAQVKAFGDRYVERLDIRTPSLQQRVQNLSGGNQQKVVIAKWLTRQPKVLILDEPTRGIDVGAKAEIYRLMRQLAAQGVGILMISSELPEVLGVSDRVLVMREGRLMGEFDPASATQDDIMSAATASAGGLGSYNTGEGGRA